MSTERLIELEIKASYQEDLLCELDMVVAKQQEQIQRLEETCRILAERMVGLSGAEGGVLSDEVPPHY